MPARPATRFERIASRYDLTNAVLSLGRHRRWKHLLIRALDLRPGEILLDAGTGTGDLALIAAARGASVVGVDLSPTMLAVAVQRLARDTGGVPHARRGRVRRRPAPGGLEPGTESIPEGKDAAIRLIRADLSCLPLADASVTAVASAFVLRHLPDLSQAFREFRRVLVPGGRVALMEFGRAAPWLRPVYDALSVTLIPLIGGMLTGDRDAYRFLVRSIRAFPEPAQVAGILAGAGFDRAHWRSVDAGVAVIYLGRAA